MVEPADYAPYGILRRVTSRVLLDMSEEEALTYQSDKSFLYLRVEIPTSNQFETWRLIHRLRTKGYQAKDLSPCKVATNASKTTARKFYRTVKD